MQLMDQNQTHSHGTTQDDRQQNVGNLAIADSSRLVTESLSWCLSAYGGFRDIETARTMADLIEMIRMQRPAVVVVGQSLMMDGARQLFSEVAVRMGETRIAVFADNLTDRQLDLLVHNRVAGFLSRDDSVSKLNEYLLRLVGGERVLSPQLEDRVEMTRDGSFRCSATSHLKKLTDRQWDVLLRIAEGRRVSEVAEDLRISSKAVESHKYRIMKTLGASDRVGLCRWAIREGLIEP